MTMTEPENALHDVTQILERMEAGDPKSADELLPLIYDELRSLAARAWRNKSLGTLCKPPHWSTKPISESSAPTNHRRGIAVVISLVLRLKPCGVFSSRTPAARTPRSGGGGVKPIDLDSVDVAIGMEDDLLLRVNEALDRLTKHDEVGAQLVKLRFFTGLTNVEAASLLGLSERTAKRTWAYARAWLHREMKRES